MSLDSILMIVAVLLALAAIPTVRRMIVGPTVLDRAVSSDMLVVLVVAGMALYTAATGSEYAIAPMLGLTALSFVGTLSVARFVSREKAAPGAVLRHPDPDSADAASAVDDHSGVDGRAADGRDDAPEDEPESDADPGLAPDADADTARAPFTDDSGAPFEDDEETLEDEDAELIDQEDPTSQPGDDVRPEADEHAAAGGAAPRVPGPTADAHEGDGEDR